VKNSIILFARHGQTERGKEDRIEGVLDSPLTALGKTQAENLAEFCLQNKVKKIYCSPMSRAKQTAQYVSDKLHIPITIKNELKEICYGEFEGKTREELQKLPIWKEREKNFFRFVHPGKCLEISGESYQMLYERLDSFFTNLQKEKEPVVVISHLGVLRSAKKFYEKVSDDVVRDYRVANSTIYVVSEEKKYSVQI